MDKVRITQIWRVRPHLFFVIIYYYAMKLLYFSQYRQDIVRRNSSKGRWKSSGRDQRPDGSSSVETTWSPWEAEIGAEEDQFPHAGEAATPICSSTRGVRENGLGSEWARWAAQFVVSTSLRKLFFRNLFGPLNALRSLSRISHPPSSSSSSSTHAKTAHSCWMTQYTRHTEIAAWFWLPQHFLLLSTTPCGWARSEADSLTQVLVNFFLYIGSDCAL